MFSICHLNSFSYWNIWLNCVFLFVAALSSIKSNIDNSNCILVQDVKAVTHAQGIRDVLSTSSPSDGKHKYLLTYLGLFADVSF